MKRRFRGTVGVNSFRCKEQASEGLLFPSLPIFWGPVCEIVGKQEITKGTFHGLKNCDQSVSVA
jgi:hypothetical protein